MLGGGIAHRSGYKAQPGQVLRPSSCHGHLSTAPYRGRRGPRRSRANPSQAVPGCPRCSLPWAARHSSERPPPPVRWRYRLYNHVFLKNIGENYQKITALLSETGTPGGAMPPPPRVARARRGPGPPGAGAAPGEVPAPGGTGGARGPVPGGGSSGRAVCGSPSLPSITSPFRKAARATCAASLGFGVRWLRRFRACPRF